MASANAQKQHQWQIGKSLIACNEYKLNNQIDCDVVFQVESPSGMEKIGAHKYMLTTRSPVFEAMLSGHFKEAQKIDISDANPSIVRDMLMYIYTDNVTLTGDNVLQLLLVAGKYILEGLVDCCTTFLDTNMDDSNVCTILTHSITYSEHNLITKCLEFIRENAEKVFQSDDFLSLSEEALYSVLIYDDISIDAETVVLESCLGWSKKMVESKSEKLTDEALRTQLGRCLFVIRFSAMSADDFANHVASRDFLTAEEKSAFFYFILTGKDTDKVKNLGFNVNKRRCPKTHLCLCYQFNNPNAPPTGSAFGFALNLGGSNDWNELLHFRVNKPVVFRGVSIYIGNQPGSKFVNMKLLHHEPEARALGHRVHRNFNCPKPVLWKTSAMLENHPEEHVSLNDRIKLEQDTVYTVDATISITPNTQRLFQSYLQNQVTDGEVVFNFTNTGSPLHGRIRGVYYEWKSTSHTNMARKDDHSLHHAILPTNKLKSNKNHIYAFSSQ